MFVLDELDKILKNLVPPPKQERKVGQFKVSLKGVEQLDVEQMQLALKVRFPPSISSDGHSAVKMGTNLARALLDDDQMKYPSLNKVFFELAYRLLLSKMTVMPERHYPSARLIICDTPCYEMLMKFNRLSSSLRTDNKSSAKNLIYRRPFGATAIFLLADVVDIFNRQREPFIVLRLDRSTGKTVLAYNNLIIRHTFPYLRMSDLLIILQDKKQIELGRFNIKSSQEHQIIQFLNHFARSTEMIELNPAHRILSKVHPIYDNVLVVDSDNKLLFNKLQFANMSLMASQLLQMVELLRLNVNSITYRGGDQSGQSKVFAQLMATGLKTKQGQSTQGFQGIAKLLVVDRFHDVASVMFHADRYGAYLEQERSLSSPINKPKVDTLDELDEQLQLVQLTDVLSNIVRYAINLKSVEIKNNNKTPNIQATSTLTSGQSIKRQLESVKSLYKSLNEGYLLMLRLEMNLEGISHELKVALDDKLVEAIGQRLERVLSTFKQLIKISGNTIRVSDLLRLACILIDVGNTFAYAVNRDNKQAINKFADGAIIGFLNGSDFEQAIDLKQDSGGTNDKEEVAVESFKGLMRKLAKFDKLSREFCPQKSLEPLRQMVEKFSQNQLDPVTFPSLELEPSRSGAPANLILAFLGSITPHELSRIKSLSFSLHVVAYNLVEPESFLKALI